MRKFTCSKCGKDSYSASGLDKLKNPACPYCGSNFHPEKIQEGPINNEEHYKRQTDNQQMYKNNEA
ncbi:MAG: hypothetical protein A4E55_02235 [Pelotomaculum sp. PtaU1.Bin035]|nr:MAG: hypothetical protein A4E55_02235 [Pelotomaculum sp. PtaU1.Bin035]